MTTKAHKTYNEIAIHYARRLHRARTELAGSKKVRELTREQVFPAFNRAGLGVALEYERMGNQPVSAELLATAGANDVEFEHLGLTLGTVIHNIDLKSDLSAELIQLIRHTLLERKVIFFRNQHLTEDEQVAFGKRFGELDAFPFGKPGDNPFILEIIHSQNSPGAENGWHTDVTWMEQPSLGSIAQCIEMPPFGGDTLFSDSHACLLGMPADLYQRIENIWGVNDYRIFVPEGSKNSLPRTLIELIKAEIPFGVNHPLVRTHPETGKQALYIHGGFLRHDSLYNNQTNEQLESQVSARLIAALLSQHSRAEYQCRFQWQPGSLAFWDNRAVQHYAASDYHPHKRVLRRVTVSGDQPFYQKNYNAPYRRGL